MGLFVTPPSVGTRSASAVFAVPPGRAAFQPVVLWAKLPTGDWLELTGGPGAPVAPFLDYVHGLAGAGGVNYIRLRVTFGRGAPDENYQVRVRWFVSGPGGTINVQPTVVGPGVNTAQSDLVNVDPGASITAFAMCEYWTGSAYGPSSQSNIETITNTWYLGWGARPTSLAVTGYHPGNVDSRAGFYVNWGYNAGDAGKTARIEWYYTLDGGPLQSGGVHQRPVSQATDDLGTTLFLDHVGSVATAYCVVQFLEADGTPAGSPEDSPEAAIGWPSQPGGGLTAPSSVTVTGRLAPGTTYYATWRVTWGYPSAAVSGGWGAEIEWYVDQSGAFAYQSAPTYTDYRDAARGFHDLYTDSGQMYIITNFCGCAVAKCRIRFYDGLGNYSDWVWGNGGSPGTSVCEQC